jgi:hypothetical protein
MFLFHAQEPLVIKEEEVVVDDEPKKSETEMAQRRK